MTLVSPNALDAPVSCYQGLQLQMSDMQENVQRVQAIPTPTARSTMTLPSMETAKGVHRALGIFIHPFTRMHKIPVFKRLWLYLTLMAVYAVGVTWVADQGISKQIFKEASNAAYISAVFGLLLVVRTNSAYERWWEGRRLWGQLVNDSRNLALKAQAYCAVPAHEKVKLGEQIVAFAYALKHHLRDSRPTKNLPGMPPIEQIPKSYHLPSQVALRLYETVNSWRLKNQISEMGLLILDPHLKAFMDVSGACERIKTTPLAVSYRAFMRQGIALNLVIMPWIVGPQLDIWISLPLILVASYFLVGLELIAEDIEDPFGLDGDDLPLDSICANIQKSITEISASSIVKDVETGLDFDPLKYTKSIKAVHVDPLKLEED